MKGSWCLFKYIEQPPIILMRLGLNPVLACQVLQHCDCLSHGMYATWPKVSDYSKKRTCEWQVDSVKTGQTSKLSHQNCNHYCRGSQLVNITLVLKDILWNSTKGNQTKGSLVTFQWPGSSMPNITLEGRNFFLHKKYQCSPSQRQRGLQISRRYKILL